MTTQELYNIAKTKKQSSISLISGTQFKMKIEALRKHKSEQHDIIPDLTLIKSKLRKY